MVDLFYNMRWQKIIWQYKLHHLFLWVLVFFVWYYLRYQDYSTTEKAIAVTAIKVFDLALLIYLCNYVLVPRLLYKKKYGLFFLSFFCLIAVSSLIKMQVLGHLLNNPALLNLSGNWKLRIYDNIIPHFFLVTAGVAVKLSVDFLSLQKRMAQIAKEKAEAELNFLKSQINPHFLFNSLNSVYFLIDKQNEEARNALHRFSEMLRYQLYECNGEKIAVEKELKFLKDFVNLQSLRLNDKTKVSFNCGFDVKNFSIEPLLLIPFVENAFKHLSHHAHLQNAIEIHLERQNGQLVFSVSNTMENEKDTDATNGGIGLVNVQRRLQLLYPNNHRLQLHKKNGWFCMELQLQINE